MESRHLSVLRHRREDGEVEEHSDVKPPLTVRLLIFHCLSYTSGG